MNIIEELKLEVEAELAKVSPKLRSYVMLLETAVEGLEADFKTNWVRYALVAFLAALVGHYV